MHKSRRLILLTMALLIGGSILVACGRSSPAIPSPTPAAKEIEMSGVNEVRSLLYCIRNPDIKGLYPYQSSGIAFLSAVLDAVYDGPIDNRSFDYQPVILQKLPSLADGDARLLPVEVTAGDLVVDVTGTPVALEAGVRVRPSGCQAEDCAIEYDGSSPLQMDQLVVRFELLPGLLWSDGEPLTASDSVYSLHLHSHPDTPGKWDFIDIERTASYQALDELRTEWTGLPGYLDGTYFTNFFTPAPEHVWGQLSPMELLTAEVSNLRPLGWGPYVIEEWDPDEGLTLIKNEYYFRRDEGLPHFDRLVFHFVEEDLNANLEKLQTGECDVIDWSTTGDIDGNLLEQLAELSNQGQIQATFIKGTWFHHLDFGIQPASYDDGWQPGDRPDFFGDVRVRRAFALCMDRQGMLEVTFSGQSSSVQDTYLHPQHPLYNPDTAHYEYDPDAGAALLEEAGWILGEDGVRVYTGDNPRVPPGTRFAVNNYIRNITSVEADQIMTDSLMGCGIEIIPSFWEGGTLFADGPEGPVFGRNFDLAQFLWGTGVTPVCSIWLSEQIPGEDTSWAGDNNTGFSHSDYDQVCLSALQSLPGQPGYVENHLRAQEIFAEQLPVIMLNFSIKVGASRPDFCGYILDPTENTDTWNIEEFNYGPDC